MIRAEPNGARERGERYLLGDMFFDVAAHGPLLPGGETAARRWLDAAHASAAAHELMRRHEGELAFDISQRRTGQTLDQRLAVAANALFVCDEQVHARAETDLDLLVSDRLHDLDGHAVPCQPPTGDRVGRENSHSLVDDLAGAKIGERPRPEMTRLLAIF